MKPGSARPGIQIPASSGHGKGSSALAILRGERFQPLAYTGPRGIYPLFTATFDQLQEVDGRTRIDTRVKPK